MAPRSAALEPAAPRRVAAIVACHNRKPLTLRLLRALQAQHGVFDLSVVLFDDGSTDGTGDAVRAQFPEVEILRGTGDAFWNGGMYRAWQQALALKPEAYLWLNDDVALDGDALVRLRDAWAAAEAAGPDGALVLAGATRSAAGEVTYGGLRRERSPLALRFVRVPPAAAPVRVDTLNGNIVLVSAGAAARVGILDPGFFHMDGDVDYGLRATRAGVPVLLLPGTLGICEANPPADLARMPLAARWRHIFRSPRGIHPASWWRLTRRHSGIWLPLHFLLPYRKLFYPARWLR